MPERRRDLILVALAATLLFLPALGNRDLWNPDEARYAQVAREMARDGSWLVPRLNDRIYSEKPPLLFWSIAAFSAPFGDVGETTARLPSALAAIATLLLAYRLGERFFNRRTGLLAALVLATCVKVPWQGRFGQIDMLLTALVTTAVWFWARGFTEERPRLYLAFFLFAGLATLAKGPAGLLPPLLSVTVFLLVTGRGHRVPRLGLGRGLLLWLAVVLAWLLPAALDAGWPYLETMVFRQNVTRYADPWHHHQPWYYYLTVLPVDAFPWSLLLPTGLVAGWRGWVRPGRDADGAAGRGRDGYLFALCWAVVTVLFFSLSPAKRSVYVLTMYPAMALLVAAGLDRLAAAWSTRGQAAADGAPARAWLLVPMALVALVGAAAVVALPVVGLERPELPALGRTFLWVLTAVMAVLATTAVVGGVLAWRRRAVAAALALAGGMAVLVLTAELYLLPTFDVFKSARPLAGELTARMAPGEEYGIYPRLDNTILFYADRPAVPVENPQALADFIDRPGRQWLCIERDQWARLPTRPPLVEVYRDPNRENGYLLLTER